MEQNETHRRSSQGPGRGVSGRIPVYSALGSSGRGRVPEGLDLGALLRISAAGVGWVRKPRRRIFQDCLARPMLFLERFRLGGHSLNWRDMRPRTGSGGFRKDKRPMASHKLLMGWYAAFWRAIRSLSYAGGIDLGEKCSRD